MSSSSGFRVDPEQVLRFSKAGPRYTSYPTAPVWKDDVGPEQAEAALRRSAQHADQPLSLYVHLPFCERRCLFCGCTVEITNQAERVAKYLDALEIELALVSDLLGDRRQVNQLHWGGGTPTHLSPPELRRLFGAIMEKFELAPKAEVSIEIHPHVTTDEQVDTLFDLGFNRVSMGVQDTDERVQAVIHRDQSVEETTRCVERCRAHGVEGINLDLMYGLPEQTEGTFGGTLDTIAALRPDRLAIYGYAHVPWLKKAQVVLEEAGLPGPVERARLFSLAVDRLSAEGYEVVGIDHFALPEDSLTRSLKAGTLERNFMGYAALPDGSKMGDMIAFGASAIGDVGGAFLQNERETAPYQEALAEGRLPTARGLVRSADDDLRRAIIQSLMCRMRLDVDELEAETGQSDLAALFHEELQSLRAFEEEGFCRVSARRVDVLPRGRLFLRHLAMAFDAYLDRGQKARFSQTV